MRPFQTLTFLTALLLGSPAQAQTAWESAKQLFVGESGEGPDAIGMSLYDSQYTGVGMRTRTTVRPLSPCKYEVETELYQKGETTQTEVMREIAVVDLMQADAYRVTWTGLGLFTGQISGSATLNCADRRPADWGVILPGMTCRKEVLVTTAGDPAKWSLAGARMKSFCSG